MSATSRANPRQPSRSIGTRRLAGLFAAALLLAVPAWAKPGSSWTVKFASSAQSTGSVVLKVAPVGGEARLIETKVPVGTSENDVARLVAANVAATLGESYRVKRTGGENVKIRKSSGKMPDYEVTLESSSLTGVRIQIVRG